jgi:hypothetical protein
MVNWHNAPVYKLAKLFTQRIGQLAPLPYTYNIENSKDLIQELKDAPILPHFAFASLDITILYPSIPVTETKEVLSDLLEHKPIDPQTQHELLNWYEVITKQNYFTFSKNTIVQNDGLSMGAPSSSIIAEIFLQHTFDVTDGRSKFILVFVVQLHNQILILNQSMCILLGNASPCDCISLWWRQCRCYALRNLTLITRSFGMRL